MTSFAAPSRRRLFVNVWSARSRDFVIRGGPVMERSELALHASRRAYERTHLVGGARGLGIAAALSAVAFGLHARTPLAFVIAAVLAATLITLGWRGGAWRRGAFAGVLAGVPPMIVPIAVAALAHGGHCTACGVGSSWACTLACFSTS